MRVKVSEEAGYTTDSEINANRTRDRPGEGLLLRARGSRTIAHYQFPTAVQESHSHKNPHPQATLCSRSPRSFFSNSAVTSDVRTRRNNSVAKHQSEKISKKPTKEKK